MTLFQVGEKVVYPNQGVGTIENISNRSYGAQSERFYLLRLTYTDMTVMVPFSHVEEIGLRRITNTAELARVLAFLSDGQCQTKADWKDRFKENSEKMRTGGLLGVAQVLKMLLLVQNSKPLSFRERTMLRRARNLMITELSISRGLQEGAAIEMLERALAGASLTLPSGG